MSDYLDEEEQLNRLKSWWDDNGMSIVIAVVVGVAGILGWNWYSSHSDTQQQEQTRLLMEYKSAEGAERSELLSQLESQFAGTAAHSLALFAAAAAATESGDYAAARDHLNTIVEQGDDDLVVDLARVRLARVLQQLDLSDAALNTLSAVRNEGYRATALETQGDIHAANGDIEQAHLAYQGALASLEPGETRPILEMKLENAEPFDGTYVPMTDQLTEALKDAATALDVQLPETQDSEILAEGEESAVKAADELADELAEEDSP